MSALGQKRTLAVRLREQAMADFKAQLQDVGF
jgi:hypothetical protein